MDAKHTCRDCKHWSPLWGDELVGDCERVHGFIEDNKILLTLLFLTTRSTSAACDLFEPKEAV